MGLQRTEELEESVKDSIDSVAGRAELMTCEKAKKQEDSENYNSKFIIENILIVSYKIVCGNNVFQFFKELFCNHDVLFAANYKFFWLQSQSSLFITFNVFIENMM